MRVNKWHWNCNYFNSIGNRSISLFAYSVKCTFLQLYHNTTLNHIYFAAKQHNLGYSIRHIDIEEDWNCTSNKQRNYQGINCHQKCATFLVDVIHRTLTLSCSPPTQTCHCAWTIIFGFARLYTQPHARQNRTLLFLASIYSNKTFRGFPFLFTHARDLFFVFAYPELYFRPESIIYVTTLSCDPSDFQTLTESRGTEARESTRHKSSFKRHQRKKSPKTNTTTEYDEVTAAATTHHRTQEIIGSKIKCLRKRGNVEKER